MSCVVVMPHDMSSNFNPRFSAPFSDRTPKLEPLSRFSSLVPSISIHRFNGLPKDKKKLAHWGCTRPPPSLSWKKKLAQLHAPGTEKTCSPTQRRTPHAPLLQGLYKSPGCPSCQATSIPVYVFNCICRTELPLGINLRATQAFSP